jgi:radical SAM superfamily enzyme YgiQ (UPF0313 family)
MSHRHVLLVQLPIPPVGPGPIRGNVPLAAGYLKMYAERRGLGADYEIEILATTLANTLDDRGLVAEILAAEPWMVGFTCYLWNIERTLWIAAELKRARPELRIIIGGPEVTADNEWVLAHPAVDFAAIGEGEQTFAELLEVLSQVERPIAPIDGLYSNGSAPPAFRRPLPKLDEISSPYLTGILDAADEEMLLLETIRGCIFKCKFCYYPKSYDDLYFLSEEQIVANLEHARRRAAREVVLLDPTLNQRRDFAGFLRLLARENPDRQFTYFGELRAEGITAEIARLLAKANFTEVEIGLQSIDPLAMELMDRHNNLRAFERGARAMLDHGIKVKVDLIIGLPGDTVDSVRCGFEYVHSSGLYSEVQVFNLAVLPGTAFRQEAKQLGLVYQDRPPYYVIETPSLRLEQMYELMEEAQEVFETEFDPLPPPLFDLCEGVAGAGGAAEAPASLPTGASLRSSPGHPARRPSPSSAVLDLDSTPRDLTALLPPAIARSQAFTLWLRSADFESRRHRAAELVSRMLDDNPFTTLQIILEPLGDPARLTIRSLESIREACYRQPTYLDKFYSVLPGRPKGAKRLVVLLTADQRDQFDVGWIERTDQYATLVYRENIGIHGDSLAGLAEPSPARAESGRLVGS